MRKLVRASEIVGIVLWSLLLAGPFGFFLWRIFSSASGPDRDFFTSSAFRSALVNSLVLSTFVGAISTSLGFFISWLLWRFSFPKKIARAAGLLLKIPYLLPPFFFAIGWIALCAPQVGYLNRATLALGLPALPTPYGLSGTIFVLTLWSTALAMIQLQSFFAQFPGSLEDAAVVAGASPFQALMKITLPLAKPHLASTVLLTALSALAAFGVPAMLGAPERSYVLTTRIFQEIKGSQRFDLAAVYCLVLLALSFVIVAVQKLVLKPRSFTLVGGKSVRPALLRPNRMAWLAFATTLAFACVSSLLPCFAIALQSLLRDRSDLTSLTLEKYVYVFSGMSDGLTALKNSLLSGGAAALLCTVLAAVGAYGAVRLNYRTSSWLSRAWNFGYALPGTVVALSLLVFFAGSLTDTLWILIGAYLAKYFAFATRTLEPATASLGKELEEAARVSGASSFTAYRRIVLPLLKPALFASLLLCFVPMTSELTMSILLVGTGTETLGALIYRLQEYADPGSAAVLAVTVSAAILFLNSILRKISRGSFGV